MAKTEQKKSQDQCKKHDLHELAEEIKNLAKKAKAKYDAADDKTKKTIIGSFAGAAALIAGVIGVKKIRDKKKE